MVHVVSAVRLAMDRHPTSTIIATYGVWALKNLSGNPELKTRLLDAVLPIVYDVAERHASVAGVMTQVC